MKKERREADVTGYRGDWLLRALGRSEDYTLDGEHLVYEPRYYACGIPSLLGYRSEADWHVMDRKHQRPTETMRQTPMTRREAEVEAERLNLKWMEYRDAPRI